MPPSSEQKTSSHASGGLSRPLRVLFMGSGSIAIPSLKALAGYAGLQLIACVTQPDRPQGRKRVLTPTPVGAWCDEHDVEVHKPESVNEADFLQFLRSLNLDLIVVFAFGQILNEELLRLPTLGCSVNVHASLLPKYRGAAPVTAALLNGDRLSGISIMQMSPALDAGGVYARYTVELNGSERAPDLECRLAALAAEKICPCLVQIAAGDLTPEPQDHSLASFAPKVKKTHGRIKWSRPAVAVERQVRAYYPWPGAWFTVSTKKGDMKLTVTAATIVDNAAASPPGTYCLADESGWIVACGEGALRLDRLIPEGRKEMSGPEYLRGRPLHTG